MGKGKKKCALIEKRAPGSHGRSVTSEAEGASGGDGEGERREAGESGGRGWGRVVRKGIGHTTILRCSILMYMFLNRFA